MAVKDNNPRYFVAETYKNKVSAAKGAEVTVDYLSNGKVTKTVSGKIEYVMNEFFGLRVNRGAAHYVVSVLFVDIFTGKIAVREIQ